jgi:membrane protein YdbS with pleckstrin-like domain
MAIQPQVQTPPTPAEEQAIFETKPAARAYLGMMIWGVLLLVFVVGIFLLLRVWYLVASTRYRLTTQRLFVQRGLIAKKLEEVELFRVKDVTLTQGVLQRMLGVGNVVVLSSDDTTPHLVLAGIPDPMAVKEQLRGAFRAARQREGLRMGEYIPS